MFKPLFLFVASLQSAAALAAPLTTAFTYQGQLTDAGAPANAAYDFEFCLFGSLAGSDLVSCHAPLETVPVSAGLFTVRLDFGASAFVGDEQFLEVRVRPDASVAAFTVLTPRQAITAAPNALHALSVGDDAIGTVQIVDGTIIGADLVSGAVNTTQIADGAVTLAKHADNSVNSSKIVDGTVTAVDIANGAVGLVQINTAEVQQRVVGACPTGQSVTGINSDGSVSCAFASTFSFPLTFRSLLDTGGDRGRHTDIAIGADGNPVISYHDNLAKALRVLHCNDAACSGADEVATGVDDTATEVGLHTSIAIGDDGLPIVSYFDDGNNALKVAKCNDIACLGANETLSTVDDPGASPVGEFSSIAIGTDGLPVIAYYAAGPGDLKVAKCNDILCAGSDETLSVVDVGPAGADVGRGASIAIGSDGFPVIAYQNTSAATLRVAKCNDPACDPAVNGAETLSTVDPGGAENVGQNTDLAIGSDGLPVICYEFTVNNALRVAKCNDAACSGSNETLSTVDPGPDVRDCAIALGIDGLPVLGYARGPTGNVAFHVAKCNDAACSGANEILSTPDDPANSVGLFGAIAIGFDGRPVMSYFDLTATSLKVLKCSSPTCP